MQVFNLSEFLLMILYVCTLCIFTVLFWSVEVPVNPLAGNNKIMCDVLRRPLLLGMHR